MPTQKPQSIAQIVSKTDFERSARTRLEEVDRPYDLGVGTHAAPAFCASHASCKSSGVTAPSVSRLIASWMLSGIFCVPAMMRVIVGNKTQKHHTNTTRFVPVISSHFSSRMPAVLHQA